MNAEANNGSDSKNKSLSDNSKVKNLLLDIVTLKIKKVTHNSIMTLVFLSDRGSGNPISNKIKESDLRLKIVESQEIIKFKIIERDPTLLRIKI